MALWSESDPARDSQEEYLRLREVMAAGQLEDCIDYAKKIASGTNDAYRKTQAWLFVMGAQITLRNRDELSHTISHSAELVHSCNSRRLEGQFYALVALFHHQRTGAFNLTAQNLVSGTRSLEEMTETGQAAVDAWHDLAIVYSNCGYHEQANYTLQKGHELAEACGIPVALIQGMEVRVRTALFSYYAGDPHAAIGILRDALNRVKPNLALLRFNDLEWVNYAIQRLKLLGQDVNWNVDEYLPDEPYSPEDIDLRAFATTCRLIQAGRGAEALDTINYGVLSSETLGVMEPEHLRSLALVACGDHAAAILASHTTIYALYKQIRQFQSMFFDSIGSLLDQEQLRKTAASFADQAFTDELTGLPNRRRLEQFLNSLRGQTMIGVLDLDNFKPVNDTHGHLAGDTVLQRVAGILSRNIRGNDLLARTGGDEFVVVLPGASEGEALTIGERMKRAVLTEDWDVYVPGTPVGVSIGWETLQPGLDPSRALWAADRAMYRAKRAGRRTSRH
ncbi:GGDEF domain-containing protein [Natronoglycomyces albus]|uniref:GGDEF domain-containing protein n=1 Tax=Natronoglycomyces albus TaxID=2811108 RepID=A0A895XJV3_9ACTN|nr:GGDEF domain-containing protein [Natronoglycomyces albus]QSB05614.1 GGDEF domain-containing protein [Natronoglycomyces albus]